MTSGRAANTDFDPHSLTKTCADCGDRYSTLCHPPEGVKFGSLFADEDEGGDFAVICLPCLKQRRLGRCTCQACGHVLATHWRPDGSEERVCLRCIASGLRDTDPAPAPTGDVG